MGGRPAAIVYLFSLFSQYVLPRGEEVWIGTLIDSLGAAGFTPQAVRMSVSRMKALGFLRSRRHGRRSYYRLSDRGLEEVQRGGTEAYHAPGDAWDGRWTLVTYSMPEAERRSRDRLRLALAASGFGSIAPGTWISPHPLSPHVAAKLQSTGAWSHVDVFRVESIDSGLPTPLLERAWPQLPKVARRYRAFLRRYRQSIRRAQAGRMSDKACFGSSLNALCEFVDLVLEDPGLPGELLPQRWPAKEARMLFRQLMSSLEAPAARYFDRLYSTS